MRKKSIKWFKLHWEWGQRADTRSSKENPLLKHWSANPEIEKMKLLGWGAVQRKLGREAASHAGQNSGSLEPREAQHSLEKGAWKDNTNLIMNPTYKDLIQERPRPWSWPESKMGRPQGRVHAPPWAGFRNYILHLCVLNPCNGFPAIVICATIKTSDAKKKKKKYLWCKSVRAWNEKESSSTEKTVLNASKAQAGRADGPHPVTVPL